MTKEKQTTRGAYDLTMRQLAHWFPEDIAFLSLGRKADELEILSPDLSATERSADWLVKATVGGETGLLQVEFQTEYSERKILDALDYRVQARKRHDRLVYSVIINLTSEGYPGPGRNRLIEAPWGHQQLFFEFREICLWELEAGELFEAAAPGLIPLVALAHSDKEPEPLNLAVEAATKVRDNKLKSNLFAAIAVLGSLKYPEQLIYSFIRRESMKESAIVQDFIREGRKEGREEGREEGRLIGEIQTCQRFLREPVTPESELQRKLLAELRALAESLEKRLQEKGV